MPGFCLATDDVPAALWQTSKNRSGHMMTNNGLEKEDILSSLREVGQLALLEGRTLEVAIYGGAAMTLQYDARVSTQDVDAVAHPEDKNLLSILAAKVGTEKGYQDGWLNDAVKGFVSSSPRMEEGSIEVPGIRILFPTAEYLLAMKCMAMRLGEEEGKDRQDIEFLLEKTGLSSAEDVIELVSSFYPENSITPKTLFGIQEIVESCSKKNTLKPPKL